MRENQKIGAEQQPTVAVRQPQSRPAHVPRIVPVSGEIIGNEEMKIGCAENGTARGQKPMKSAPRANQLSTMNCAGPQVSRVCEEVCAWLLNGKGRHNQVNNTLAMIRNNSKERFIMYKPMLFLLVLCAYSFSQTPIPKPTGYPNVTFVKIVNIGDFDGDSSDDMYIQLYDNSGTGCNKFGIYSKKTNSYLIPISTCGAPETPDAIGHFDGDKSLEIVVNGIIYRYNSTLTKKKI